MSSFNVSVGGTENTNAGAGQTGTADQAKADPNFSLPANLWEDPVDKTQAVTPPPPPSPPQSQAPTFDYNSFYNSLNIGQGIDWAKAAESPENLSQAVRQYGADLYRQAFLASKQHMESQLEKYKADVLTQARSTNHAELLVARMHKDMPFTSDPNTAPMANAVLQRALKFTGGDQDKALEMVKGFFSATAKNVATHIPEMSSNSRGGPKPNDEDWTSFMLG